MFINKNTVHDLHINEQTVLDVYDIDIISSYISQVHDITVLENIIIRQGYNLSSGCIYKKYLSLLYAQQDDNIKHTKIRNVYTHLLQVPLHNTQELYTEYEEYEMDVNRLGRKTLNETCNVLQNTLQVYWQLKCKTDDYKYILDIEHKNLLKLSESEHIRRMVYVYRHYMYWLYDNDEVYYLYLEYLLVVDKEEARRVIDYCMSSTSSIFIRVYYYHRYGDIEEYKRVVYEMVYGISGSISTGGKMDDGNISGKMNGIHSNEAGGKMDIRNDDTMEGMNNTHKMAMCGMNSTTTMSNTTMDITNGNTNYHTTKDNTNSTITMSNTTMDNTNSTTTMSNTMRINITDNTSDKPNVSTIKQCICYKEIMIMNYFNLVLKKYGLIRLRIEFITFSMCNILNDIIYKNVADIEHVYSKDKNVVINIYTSGIQQLDSKYLKQCLIDYLISIGDIHNCLLYCKKYDIGYNRLLEYEYKYGSEYFNMLNTIEVVSSDTSSINVQYSSKYEMVVDSFRYGMDMYMKDSVHEFIKSINYIRKKDDILHNCSIDMFIGILTSVEL